MATTKKSVSKKSPTKKTTSAKNKTPVRSKTKAAASTKKTLVKRATKSAASAKKNATTATKPVTKKTAVTSKKKQTASRNPMRALLTAGAILSAALAGAVLYFGNDIEVGVLTNYLTQDILNESGRLLPAITELFSFNLKYLIVGLLAAGALWRVLLLTYFSKKYQDQVSGKFTSLNWVELGVFGPVVFITLGLFVGIRDVASLALLATVPAMTSVLGYVSDRYNMLQNGSWLKMKVAIEMLMLPWVVIGLYLLHTYVYGFVTFNNETYGVLAAAFAAYLLLAVIHKKQILGEGKFVEFSYGEQWILSLHLILLLLVGALAFV